jgi:peptide/nickel transport system substrate-binding protein
MSGPTWGAVLLAMVLVAAACSGSDTGDDGGGDGGGQAGGGTDTAELVVAVSSLGTMEWEPWLSNIENLITTSHVGDTLTTVDPETMEVRAGLAESWELSDDLTTWTFRLRPDVPFQDDWGTVTADDVEFSWGQYISEESIHFIKPQMSQAVDGDMANFEVVDDLEFRLHTTDPVVDLPALISDIVPSMPVQSQAYFEAEPETALDHPLGTGPWKFVSSTPGVEIVLEAVPDHWRLTPAFDRLVIKEVPDDAARLAQVQSGEVDLALLGSGLAGEAESSGLSIRSVRDIGNCSVTLGGSYTGEPEEDRDAPWIQADEPEKGQAIREAMSLAIDRAAILDTIIGGHGTLTHGPIVEYGSDPDRIDPSWELPAFDLDAAREKLAEGGYPDGFPVNVALFTQLGASTAGMGEAVAGMWEELGLDVTRENTEQDLMRPLFQERTTDGMAWVFCSPFQLEAELALPNAWTPAGRNTQAFDPAITEAYEQLTAEPDRDARYALTRDLLEVLMDNHRLLPLLTIDQLWVAGDDVGDWTPLNGINRLNSLDTVTPAS